LSLSFTPSGFWQRSSCSVFICGFSEAKIIRNKNVFWSKLFFDCCHLHLDILTSTNELIANELSTFFMNQNNYEHEWQI
jgi:hypothetical protein